LNFNHFWHTTTSVNVLSQACFTLFVTSTAENQLKYKHWRACTLCWRACTLCWHACTLCMHKRQAASSQDAEFHHSTKPVVS